MKFLFVIMAILQVLGFVHSRPNPKSDQIQILIQEFGIKRAHDNNGYGRGPDYTFGEAASVGRFVCYLTEDLGNSIY